MPPYAQQMAQAAHGKQVENKKKKKLKLNKNMKHLLPTRHLLTLLLTCFMALGAQADPIKFYVSQKRGNDSRNGTSWHAAFKTLDAALRAVNSSANLDAVIYMAEGKYNVDTNPVGGKGQAGYYTLTRKGQSLRIYGGFPTPGSQTLPQDTCSNNPKAYVTELVATKKITQSVFRTNNANQKLALQGVSFNSPNFVGNAYNGSLITLDNNNLDNVTFSLEDCRISYYRSSGAGAIFVYGNIKNPKIRMHRVEVIRGESFGGHGGGFLTASTTGNKVNSQIDISYITLHDIQHVGVTQEGAVIGWTNAGTWDENPNAYVKIDHMQVNRASGGTASSQHGTFFFEGFKDIRVTNSNFHNSKGGDGGLFRIASFVNFYSENNSFYNNFGGDVGGAIYIYDGSQAASKIDKTNPSKKRSIVFKNDEFYGNNAGKTSAKGDGGAVAIKAANDKMPCDVTIENCNFKNNNTTAFEGGALWLGVAGKVNIKNSIFCGNKANTKGDSGTGAGGAICLDNASKFTVEGSYFGENSNKKDGGAIEIRSQKEFEFRNCVFKDNQCDCPQAITNAGGGAVAIFKGYGKFVNCKFFGNKTGSIGGAVSMYHNGGNPDKTIDFDNCLFEDNTSKMNGGVIGMDTNGCLVRISNSIFKNNSCEGYKTGGNGGGVISMNVGCAGVELRNNTIINNTSFGGGGVVWYHSGYVHSENNRYYSNKAEVGGVFQVQDVTNIAQSARRGLVSDKDIFYGNEAKDTTGKGSAQGGVADIFTNQHQNVSFKNGSFVNNISYAKKAGGCIYAGSSSALVTGDYFLVDSIYNCTFYNNQCLDDAGKLSTTTQGADIGALKNNYSIMCAQKSKLQCAESVYIGIAGKARWKAEPDVQYSSTYNPNVPTTPAPIAGQGYTAPTDAEQGTEQNPGMKVDCKEIHERQDIDVTKPHADIITNKERPTTFATYCTKVKDEKDPEKQIWAEFQSIGGEGPYQFTYDIWKQKGRDIKRIVKDATVETSKEKYRTPDYVLPIYDYDQPIIENGDTIGYVKTGEKKIEGTWEYPDSVILRGPKLIESKYIEEGATFTIIVKKLTDHFGMEYHYDCYGDYNEQRKFSQNLGAQIFFEGCDAPSDDLDWDKDGILNTTECNDLAPNNLTALTENELKSTNGKWVRYRENVKTQKLFATMVNDPNYLNDKPETNRRVLTLLPSVLGVTQGFTGEKTFDISDKFGYAANSGAVVVKIADCLIDEDRFMTASSQNRLTSYWEIGGTMKPYVLMQSTPKATFHADNYFAINVLTNSDTQSQTELYTDLTDHRYTVFENEGTKKVIFNNEDANLTNIVGLSHLNAEPNTKYFNFTQSPDQSGMVSTLVTIMLPCDDDMDGIPNFFDEDSDGDGCLDAIEGGDNVTEDMVDEQGRITGEVDANGVPVAVNAGGKADKDGAQGQGSGSAYDSNVNACGNNYWTGDVDNDFNKKENWTNDVPKDGQNIIFANNQPDAKGKVAVRDLHLPAGKFISANKLENNAPNEKFEKDATTKTAGHPAVVVPADGGLTVKSVEGFTTDGDKDKLVMKTSDDGKKVGTFILNNTDPCASTVFATVEFKPLGDYVAGRKTTDDKDTTSPDYNKPVLNEFDWQYIGLPVVETTKNPSFEGMWVRAYDEKLNDADHYYRKWTAVKNTDKMKAFIGYEVAPVKDGSNGVHKIQGKLNLCEQTIELTRQASVVTASKATEENAKRYGLGYNIVGNSFMAGVDINKIKLESGETGVDMDNTVYIYTTGSWDEWKNQNGQSVTEKGGYEAVNIGKAGENGVTRTLSPMQGFMVKYNNPKFSTTTGKLTIPYAGLKSEAEPLRAKSFVMDGDFSRGSVMVTMDNGKVVDKFWTYQEENATPAYDPQLEGEKLNMGEPSVFATTTDGKNVQISSLPSLIGSKFSVETAKGDTYNMELNAWSLNYQNLKLVDLKNKTVIPFNNGKARYFFTATVDGIEHDRFMFADTPETDFKKVMGAVTGIDNVSITLTKGEAELFNLSGAKVGTFSLPLDAKKLKGQVPAGVYLIKATDGTNVQTSKIVIE